MNYFPMIPATKASTSRRKLIFGYGVNDSNYVTDLVCNGVRVRCPFYVCWTNMLNRVLNDKYKENQPTYIGASVCNDWLLFSNFRKWMMTQDWIGKELDKDIRVVGNKTYSPDHCLFVTKEVNMITNDHDAKRGSFMQGVTLCVKTGRFLAQISRYGVKGIKIGSFKREIEAHNAYRKEKARYIMELSEKEEDKHYRAHLENYAKRFTE